MLAVQGSIPVASSFFSDVSAWGRACRSSSCLWEVKWWLMVSGAPSGAGGPGSSPG